MEPVKLGVIGCGVIGRQHTEKASHSPLIDLVALADLREEPLKTLAEEFKVPQAYANADDLINDPDVEGVVLAMPAFVRTEICLKAFAAGKHVLNEKPIAMSCEEVETMIEARGDLTAAACSSRMHYSDCARKARELLREGILGDIRVIRINGISGAGAPPASDPIPWRYKTAMNAGGIMSNWGCYDLDYILGLFDWKLKPLSISAQTWTIAPELESRIAPDSDAETHAAALIKFKGGIAMMMERGEQIGRQSRSIWEITGTKGTLHLTMTPGGTMTIIHDDIDPEKGIQTSTVFEGAGDWDKIHAGPIEDFARAIRGEKKPNTGLEEAMIIRKITEGMYQSSETGKEVIF